MQIVGVEIARFDLLTERLFLAENCPTPLLTERPLWGNQTLKPFAPAAEIDLLLRTQTILALRIAE